MGDVLNLGQEKQKRVGTPGDWTPTELLNSMSGEDLTRGILVIWIDPEGLVQIRRSKLEDADELRCLRTAGNSLLGEIGRTAT